jgi:hypothetical protein
MFDLLKLVLMVSKGSKDKFFERTCGDFDMVSSKNNISIWYDKIPFLFIFLDEDVDFEWRYELSIHELDEGEDLQIIGVDDV